MRQYANLSQRAAKVISGAFTLGVCQSISKGLFLVFILLAANYLDSEATYGSLESALALALIFYHLIGDLGTDDYTVRELSRRRDRSRQWLPGMISLRVLLMLLSVLGLALWQLFMPSGWSPAILWLILLYTALLAAQAYLKSIARAWERLYVEGVMAIADKAVLLIAGLVVVLVDGGLLGLWIALVISNLVACLVGLLMQFRVVPGLLPGWPPNLPAVRYAVPFWLGAACMILVYSMDKVMLKYLIDDEATGIYSAGHRLVIGLFIIPQMLSVALYPAVSHMHTTGENYLRMVRHCFRVLLGLSIPMTVGGILIAPQVFALLWPGQFANSVPVFRILMLCVPFVFVNYVTGPLLKAVDRQWDNMRCAVLALVVNFFGNLVLIVLLGPAGAAWATVTTQAVLFASMALLAHLRVGHLGWLAPARLSLVASLAMLAAIWPLRHHVLPAILAGLLVYAAAAWLLGLITPADLNRFRRAQ